MLKNESIFRNSSPEYTVAQWLAKLDYHAMLDHETSGGIPIIERFDWQGRKLEPGFRRVRVMARQTFVLCQAALASHGEVGGLAERAATALIRHGVGDQRQFVSRLSPEGATIDDTPDLYDIAFGLFAMAWWYRVSGDRMALSVAEQSIAHLYAVMQSPSGMGFVSRLGAQAPLSQNPHMHLFEAAIVLAQFSGQDIFLDLANTLFALASQRLIDPVTGALPEFFDAAWRPLGAAEDGYAVRIEPGHLYEWCWLLHRYAALVDSHRAIEMADRLYAFAQAHGHDRATGLIVDAVGIDGGMIAPHLRLWPNTEYLKAQVVMRERYGSQGFEQGIAQNVDRIFRHYLTAPKAGPASHLREGFWIDYLQADAVTPKCDHVPASTLYHICFAFSELLMTNELMIRDRGNAHDAYQTSPGHVVEA